MRLPAVIRGLGTATPAHAITQAHAASLAKTFGRFTELQARRLKELYQRSRVRTRGSVLLERRKGLGNGRGVGQSFFPAAAHEQDRGPSTQQRLERYAAAAPPLARAASATALRHAQVGPQDITHLVTVSCTGFAAPGVDIQLTKELGLPSTVERTHVGFMGCHGALNGLRVASAIVQADPGARVLLCAVELCSLHFAYGRQPDQMVANALFADGAAAAVVAPGTSPPPGAWKVQASGSCVFPDSEADMSWRIGDHGFEMALSLRVPALIGAHLPGWLGPWLERCGSSLAQIRSWAVHPGGPRILEAVAAGLGLPESALEPSWRVFAECGNMSSPTLLFILERLWAQQAPRPCVAMGFGPGLTVEAALLA